MSVDLSKITDSSSIAESELLANGGAPAEATAKKNHSSKEIDAKERHLSTDHLLTDLKGRTISGAFITIAAQGTQFVLSLASIMILARLLTPKDFGLFAMVSAVMGYLRLFKDAGLSTATVQREGITQAQVSNLFWINVGLSGAITLLLAACSPLVAWFYREPRLVGITLTLSGTFLLNGLAIQHSALLSRQMRFNALAGITISSTVIGMAVAIGMALLGCNYWALVISNLVTVLTMTLFTWLAIPWRPHAPSRRSGVRPLISFGANMASGGFIYDLALETDGMLIGRFCGAGPLGLYSRAAALLRRPMDQFLSPIGSVFLPVLSRVQSQPERYRRAFLQIYEAIALITFLFTGLFLALSYPVTLAVLGPKWDAAAIIFAGFTLAALTHPLTCTSTWLFATQGRGKDWVRASSIVSGITVCSFLVGLPFGPAGVAISYSASCVLLQLPLLYYIAGRQGPVSRKDLWIGCLRHLPVWGVVCGTAWLARTFILDANPWMQLFLCAPVGLLAGAAYIGFSAPSRRVAVNLLSIIRDLKNARLV